MQSLVFLTYFCRKLSKKTLVQEGLRLNVIFMFRKIGKLLLKGGGEVNFCSTGDYSSKEEVTDLTILPPAPSICLTLGPSR